MPIRVACFSGALVIYSIYRKERSFCKGVSEKNCVFCMGKCKKRLTWCGSYGILCERDKI